MPASSSLRHSGCEAAPSARCLPDVDQDTESGGRDGGSGKASGGDWGGDGGGDSSSSRTGMQIMTLLFAAFVLGEFWGRICTVCGMLCRNLAQNMTRITCLV